MLDPKTWPEPDAVMCFHISIKGQGWKGLYLTKDDIISFLQQPETFWAKIRACLAEGGENA